MDKVKKTFDEWALSGRSELMEREHGRNVLKFLYDISFDNPFSFLDVGCGERVMSDSGTGGLLHT